MLTDQAIFVLLRPQCMLLLEADGIDYGTCLGSYGRKVFAEDAV